MKLLNNVYLLSGLLYGVNENVYGIATKNELILIDTGRGAEALQNIKRNIVEDHLSDLPIKHVLLTHMHDDHIGNAAYFRAQGALILCSEPDASGVESGGIRVNDVRRRGEPKCTVDRRLVDNETFIVDDISFVCRLYPGHTNGSVFYYFELNGTSFCATGDTVFPLQNEGGYEAGLGWAGSYEFNKALYMVSLEKSLDYPFDVMLGGHGFPLLKNGYALIGQAFRKTLIEWR